MATGQLSADGSQYWNGQQWVPTVSPDGRWRWDGAKWVPATGQASTQLAPIAESRPVMFPPSVFVQTAPTNSLAVAALVFGILSWFLCPFIGGVIAVITGHMARSQIRTSGEGGGGMAMAGLILGYIHLAAFAIVTLFWLLIFGGIAALLGAGASSR